MELLNEKYTVTEEVIKTGNTVREVVRHMDAAWIPGLDKIMNKVPVIISMDLELKNLEEGIDRRFYRIVKNYL